MQMLGSTVVHLGETSSLPPLDDLRRHFERRRALRRRTLRFPLFVFNGDAVSRGH